MTALQTNRQTAVSNSELENSDSESETSTSLSPSTLPAAQTLVLAEVVSKIAEVAASNCASSNINDTVANATYVPPGLEVIHFPEHLNTYDGFTVSGQVWGSEISGQQVQVSICGATRSAEIIDGLWDVFFEDGALPRYRHGTCDITAVIRDSHGSMAQNSIMVTLEEFADGYVQIDQAYSVLETARGDMLCVSGELALGTHDMSRDLVVHLVHADPCNRAAARGIVKSGWQFGEWKAQLPLSELEPGDYYVRAQLVDCANTALTHIAMGTKPITI